MNKLKRSGFTLVELIFVIVIIGVLSAIAVPKFANLKENAEISNMIKAITQISENGQSAYMNETELNDRNMSNVNLTDGGISSNTGLFEFKGKGWTFDTANPTKISTYTVGTVTMDIEYQDTNGTIDVTITDTATPSTVIPKVNTKTGITFVSGTARNFDLTK